VKARARPILTFPNAGLSPGASIFVKLPEKIEIVSTRIHDPQISNQIDAAV